MGVCNYSIFCYALRYVHSSFVIILMGKRDLIALLSLSFWCLVIALWPFLEVPIDCLRFVIVVFHDHTHLHFFVKNITKRPINCEWDCPTDEVRRVNLT